MNHIKTVKKEQEWKIQVNVDLISLKEKFQVTLILVALSIGLTITLFMLSH